MIGKTISHYKILEKLGEGGMGVVYKAEDTKLERTVALKFLSLTSIGDEEKKRFKREAKAAASLNHPNIATIFAIDEADDQTFIAMEYIEGKSLQDIVGAGHARPLPLDKAIDYATQTAAGLQAAHEKGITHRDIKSANIMVTDKGQIKIMDFGLAKLANRSKLTQLGTTLGTAAYMSPEQSRGENTDHRSDIWSLGVVLYEMISGQMPFKGDYEQAVIYSIQNEEPEPLTALRTGVPIALDGIIAKALTKDAGIRYQNVEELPADLRGLGRMSTAPGQSSLSVVTNTLWGKQISRNTGMLVLLMLVGALVGTAITALVMNLRESAPSAQSVLSAKAGVIRSFVNLSEGAPLAPAQLTPFSYLRPSIALSRDGSRLVYVADIGGNTQLYLRDMNEFWAKPIPGTESGFDPFFSPNGEWVGFFTDDKLKKVSLKGGAPEVLCDTNSPVGGTWSDGDVIYFAQDEGVELMRVSASGGSVDEIECYPERSHFFAYPQVLPGDKGILYISSTRRKLSNDYSNITLRSLAGEKREIILVERGYYARYVQSGHLIFVRRGGLMAIAFDVDNLEVTGPPVSVLDHVTSSSLTNASAQFALSQSGSLVYVPGRDVGETIPVWVDRKGKAEPLPISARHFGTFQLSPDGTRLAIEIADVNDDIYIYDIATGRPSRLTLEGDNDKPVWTRDGTRVIFRSSRDGKNGMFWKHVDGTGNAELLLPDSRPASTSPDGKWLLLRQGGEILSLSLDGGRPNSQQIVQREIPGFHIRFSPDGQMVAYTSAKTDRFEVYLQSYPKADKVWQVSSEGGEEPVWAPSGKELFYRYGNNWLAVSISGDTELKLGAPRLLFKGSFQNPYGHSYDIDRQSDRFLMLQSKHTETRITQLNLVLTWYHELNRLVPRGKP